MLILAIKGRWSTECAEARQNNFWLEGEEFIQLLGWVERSAYRLLIAEGWSDQASKAEAYRALSLYASDVHTRASDPLEAIELSLADACSSFNPPIIVSQSGTCDCLRASSGLWKSSAIELTLKIKQTLSWRIRSQPICIRLPLTFAKCGALNLEFNAFLLHFLQIPTRMTSWKHGEVSSIARKDLVIPAP